MPANSRWDLIRRLRVNSLLIYAIPSFSLLLSSSLPSTILHPPTALYCCTDICYSQFLSNVSISFTIHHSISSDCLKLLYCYLSFPSSSLYDLLFFVFLLLSVIVFLPAEFLSFVLLLMPDCWTHKHKGIVMTITVRMLYFSAVCFWRFPKNVCFGVQQTFWNNHDHCLSWGTRWRRWLRHCATNRKVAGSIPDGVTGIFHWHNPSGRTMALSLTQPLTEMSTRNTSWR